MISPTPAPVLLAEVTRGAATESRHYGHVCAVTSTGEVLLAAGAPDRPTFARSSLKPLQALAAVACGVDEAFQLSDAEVAVMCASHQAEPRHREVVTGLLQKVGAGEELLHCGAHPPLHQGSREELVRSGQPPSRLHNNCSGKHAGMLALARVLGAPLEGYWELSHPVQREILRVVTLFCDVDGEELPFGIDGCGVPTWLLPLRNLALGFARLSEPSALPSREAEAARRVTRAMMAEPGLVSGQGGRNTLFMESLPGALFCKGGAEGCEAAGLPGRGIGIAIKVEDGASRPLSPVLLSLLKRFGVVEEELPHALGTLARPTLTNTCGQAVGEIRSCI